MAKFCKWKASTVLHNYQHSNTPVVSDTQIIADHTIVADYVNIPEYYINEVKKMWVSIPGESHSLAYRVGAQLLSELDSTYAVNVTSTGTPEAYTDQYLRLSRATRGSVSSTLYWTYSYGEEDWYTTSTAIANTKYGLSYCNTAGPTLAAIGFGWCWDMTWTNGVTGTKDPVYGCGWAGSSENGPDGNLPWGLDAEDSSITGNSVCMDTYLNATQQYIDYCTANGIATKVFFTTGPVDGSQNTEGGYQRYLKHEYIRNYVKQDSSRILFDYADILCYDDDNTINTGTWNGHTTPYITSTNLGAANVGHIGSAGSIRLAKALWWMLARIAGWDGT
jgi:hypothetical protein